MESSSTIGIGVIGCGGMGRSILRRVLAIDPRLRVVGLCDPDPRSIAATCETIGQTPPVFADHRALCAVPTVDWVMIASWNSLHREHTVTALDAGKHVFCQKPLATTLEDCMAMVAAQRRSGRMFNIGFSLRYSPHYRKIKQLLAAGAVGRIMSMEFNETLGFNHGGYIMGDWRRLREHAGTHLLEKCCHDLDLADWMVESRARRVASFGGLNFFTPDNTHHIERIGADAEGNPAFSGWPGLFKLNPFTSDKDIVDNQVAIIEYANGVRATFHTNCNTAMCERRMYIVGTEGTLRADVLTGKIHVQKIGHDTQPVDESTEASGMHGGGDDVLAHELAESMLRGTPPGVGLREGLESAVTAFAIDEAMDKGCVVDLAGYWERAGE